MALQKPVIVTPDLVGSSMNILIYGPQGAGKTWLASTAQDHDKLKDVLFLAVEKGMLTVASRKDIHMVPIRSTDDLEAYFWAIQRKDPDFVKFKTVVIDSGTELQTVNLDGIVQAAFDRGLNGGKKRESIDDIYQDDYGKSTRQLYRILRFFRDLGINVVITALPKVTYPKNVTMQDMAKPIDVRPSFTTKLGDSVMACVDFVWYLMSKTEEEMVNGQKQLVTNRYLLTRDYDVFRAKTRGVKFGAALGTWVKNPTLPSLYDTYMRSEQGEKVLGNV